MAMQRIIIFANGELPDINKARAILKDDDYVICADGGMRHALVMDLKPDLLIGDMDSTEKSILKKLRDDGVPIELFPREKNETDLELAVNRALELDPKEIVIVAGLGGRIDQTLANIALLGSAKYAKHEIHLNDGLEEIFSCSDQIKVHGRVGDIVSLIPWGGPVHHIQTQGLKWALNDETLPPARTRGISNEMISNNAFIKIGSGLLLVVVKHISKG